MGVKKMRIVKTWCENTQEGEDYLRYNGYANATRMFGKYYVCTSIGNPLRDVEIIK